jgi:hypothetical protein
MENRYYAIYIPVPLGLLYSVPRNIEQISEKTLNDWIKDEDLLNVEMGKCIFIIDTRVKEFNELVIALLFNYIPAKTLTNPMYKPLWFGDHIMIFKTLDSAHNVFRLLKSKVMEHNMHMIEQFSECTELDEIKKSTA